MKHLSGDLEGDNRRMDGGSLDGAVKRSFKNFGNISRT